MDKLAINKMRLLELNEAIFEITGSEMRPYDVSPIAQYLEFVNLDLDIHQYSGVCEVVITNPLNNERSIAIDTNMAVALRRALLLFHNRIFYVQD